MLKILLSASLTLSSLLFAEYTNSNGKALEKPFKDLVRWVRSDVEPKLAQIDVSSAANASTSLAKISAAIEQVAGDRAGYGALQNRLEYTVSNLLNVAEYTTAARSRIEDADFAAESARLAKAQVLQQSGTAMLAQANASSQLALSLFR